MGWRQASLTAGRALTVLAAEALRVRLEMVPQMLPSTMLGLKTYRRQRVALHSWHGRQYSSGGALPWAGWFDASALPPL